MNYLKQAWRYLVVEPFSWIFFCVFQPARFKWEYEKKGSLRRAVFMLRLVLPIFLFQLGGLLLFSRSDFQFWFLSLELAVLLQSVTAGMIGGIIPGIVSILILFPIFSTRIFLGFSIGFASTAGDIFDNIVNGGLIAFVGIASGVLIGAMWRITEGLTKAFTNWPTNGRVLKIVSFFTRRAFATESENEFPEVITRGISKGFLLSSTLFLLGDILSLITSAYSIETTTESFGLQFSIDFSLSSFGLVLFWVWMILEGTEGNTQRNIQEDLGWGIGLGIGWSLGAMAISFLIALLSFLPFFKHDTTPLDAFGDAIWTGFIVLVCYLLGHFRVLLYPVSALSCWRAYFASRRNPTRVFASLHRSALYWDECVFLPLPFLKTTLLMAFEQSVEQTVEEVHYIATKRPQQLYWIRELLPAMASRAPELTLQELQVIIPRVARWMNGDELGSEISAALYQTAIHMPEQTLEMIRTFVHERSQLLNLVPGALRETAIHLPDRTLEMIRTTLREKPQQFRHLWLALFEVLIQELEKHTDLLGLAQVSQWLVEVVNGTPFEPLVDIYDDASRDAARYLNLLNLPGTWQERVETLESLFAHLKLDITIEDHEDLEERYNEVLRRWRTLAQTELNRLRRSAEQIDQIVNPYNPGPPLKLNDPLFVGRYDLIQRLRELLGRGDHCPILQFYGETRIGKTSTLRQLPKMLDSRYLPAFCNLQDLEYLDTPTVLGLITAEISTKMRERGIDVKPLEEEELSIDASTGGDSLVYYRVNRWLMEIENVLEESDCTLLVTLDELGTLEELVHSEPFRLRSFLTWLCSLSQNRSRIALLFSGVQRIDEMGMKTGVDWAELFGYVQMLKVGFLEKKEAIQLIVRPTADFEGERIFDESVVDSIIRETGCHAFLVQAVCSALISRLNAERLLHPETPRKASLEDVAKATDEVLDGYSLFRTLWNRSDQKQRSCLAVVRRLGEAQLDQVEQLSGYERRTVVHTMKRLRYRDLILCQENGSYRISNLIFEKMIQRFQDEQDDTQAKDRYVIGD